MASALKTTVTELGDSRVRVQVQVPPEELEGRLERKALQLGRELKLPGFRRGKVPAPLVIQRIGREAVLEEAVRDTISAWYSDAIDSAGIVPVGDPKLALGELPPKGKALEFSIEIGVLPRAELGAYRGLEVPRREPEVKDAEVEEQIEQLRERLARLQTAERPAESGDFVVVDYAGALISEADGESEPLENGQARDQLIELGSQRLIPGFEEALLGARAGETRTFEARFPDDYASEQLAGRRASFEVSVKEVKLKELPELDDDFALDAGFDDLAQLRADVRERLAQVEQTAVEEEFRRAALDAAVDNARIEVTPELVSARAREMWERMLHSLARRGVSREAYLRISGRREEEVLEELEPEAERALRREAVITAIVAAEGIEPSEEDMLEALAASAQHDGVAPEQMLEELRASGHLEDLREDLAARQAIDLIAGAATPIPLEQAQAREKLWTPERAAGARTPEGAASPPARLWTPDR